jgi:hypothetical protein
MMETDWSVAAGADDPVIEAPWWDAATRLGWVDLRVDAEAQRGRLAALPEASASPAMAAALMLLNAPHSLLMTTKCDRWQLSELERADLADVTDAPMVECGFGSYIDVLVEHAMPMTDFLLHEEWARTAACRCAALSTENARIDLVVRPAYKDNLFGYGLTVYCYAGAADAQRAEAMWTKALEQIIRVLISAAEALLLPTRG